MLRKHTHTHTQTDENRCDGQKKMGKWIQIGVLNDCGSYVYNVVQTNRVTTRKLNQDHTRLRCFKMKNFLPWIDARKHPLLLFSICLQQTLLVIRSVSHNCRLNQLKTTYKILDSIACWSTKLRWDQNTTNQKTTHYVRREKVL